MPARARGNHLPAVARTADSNVLAMCAPVVTPRPMAASVQVSLESKAHNVVEPNWSRSVKIRLTAPEAALCCAHLLENAVWVPHEMAESCRIGVCETVVANSTPGIVVPHLESTNLFVTINQSHICSVDAGAAGERARADALSNVPVGLASKTAKTYVVSMLTTNLSPWCVLAVTNVAFLTLT